MALAVHKLAIQLAQGAFDSRDSDCNDIENPAFYLVCITEAQIMHDADIATADAALAAAKTDRDAAVAAAEAAYNDCVDDAYALYESCIGGGGVGGGRGGEE